MVSTRDAQSISGHVRASNSPRRAPDARAELDGGDLSVRAENSGSGETAGISGSGVGLRNVRRRLEIRYGPPAALALPVGAEWTTAELRTWRRL